MAGNARFRIPLRWAPDDLGRSIPIARQLWMSRIALALLAALLLALVVHRLWRTSEPEVEELSDAVVRAAVLDRLARAELPRWDPGEDLPEAELPEHWEVAPPPVWQGRHPRDPATPPAAAREGLAELVSGDDTRAAATLLDRAADAQPTSWSLAYNSGVAFLRAGFANRAAARFEAADERLVSAETRYADDPTHVAAKIATRYAAAAAAKADDCPLGINHLKRAIGELRRYVETEGVLVFDRRLPFAIEPPGLDNHDIWHSLMRAYLDCSERYPAEYFGRWQTGKRFNEAEYANPGVEEIRQSPFAEELTECVDSNGATARCWALSNLNQLLWANRDALHAAELPRSYEEHRETLVQLAYNVARFAAEGQAPERGVEYLRIAARLDGSSADSATADRIEQLGRHLAARTRDYSLLAEPYRGRESLEVFTSDAPLETVKGMAWALTDRWQRYLESEKPEQVLIDVDKAIKSVPGDYLTSLQEWRSAAITTLQDELLAEIKLERRRGNDSLAVALRDYRAPYLGDDYSERAGDAWWSWSLYLLWFFGLLLWSALALGLAWIHRSLVFPYLLYTADYYKTEFRHRHDERLKSGKPFTGDEIDHWARSRDQP